MKSLKIASLLLGSMVFASANVDIVKDKKYINAIGFQHIQSCLIKKELTIEKIGKWHLYKELKTSSEDYDGEEKFVKLSKNQFDFQDAISASYLKFKNKQEETQILVNKKFNVKYIYEVEEYDFSKSEFNLKAIDYNSPNAESHYFNFGHFVDLSYGEYKNIKLPMQKNEARALLKKLGDNKKISIEFKFNIKNIKCDYYSNTKYYEKVYVADSNYKLKNLELKVLLP